MAGQVLRGNLKIGDDAATAADVSGFVTQFELLLVATSIMVPQTFASRFQETRFGPETNTLTVTYFTDDGAATLTAMLVAAFETQAELYFEGSFQPGVVSATNELYFGTFVPITTMKGGTAGTLAVATSTFPVNTWGHSAVPGP